EGGLIALPRALHEPSLVHGHPLSVTPPLWPRLLPNGVADCPGVRGGSADGPEHPAREPRAPRPAVPAGTELAADPRRIDRLEEGHERTPPGLVVGIPPGHRQQAAVLGDKPLLDHLVQTELR